MNGPFQLSDVDAYVQRVLPGAYILSRDQRTAHYVGRSDTDLASRLKSHISSGKDYAWFWFEPTTSSIRAYYFECEWYHKYLPPDNSNHPSAPPGTSWKCPIPGCPWG